MRNKSKVNYTNELELKTLLIRAKNRALNVGITKYNRRIKELLLYYLTIEQIKQQPKLLEHKKKIREHIIWFCERTCAGAEEMDRLGKIINLMISRILTKPQFSGYTYDDEFYSDAQYKIFRYMTNFDHKKISKISGERVNAFAYVTQIIHNSIIHVIASNKNYYDKLKAEYKMQRLKFMTDMGCSKYQFDAINETYKVPEIKKCDIYKFYYNVETFDQDFSEYLSTYDSSKVNSLTVTYPKGADITKYAGYDITFIEG